MVTEVKASTNNRDKQNTDINCNDNIICNDRGKKRKKKKNYTRCKKEIYLKTTTTTTLRTF